MTRPRIRIYFAMCGIGLLVTASSACAAVWYVDKAAPPGGDGTAWSTAFTEIQPAIDAAYNDGGGEIWVAEGVYDEQRFLQQGAVVISEGVSVFGGFSGEETRIEDRDWTLHETVIDGATSQGGNRANRVVHMGKNSRLDGLIVQGGLSAGIELVAADNAVVSHCVIRDNIHKFPSYYAITKWGGHHVRLEYCQVRDNGGGAILGGGSLTLFRCDITSNKYGSWLYVEEQALQVIECLFADHPNGALSIWTTPASGEVSEVSSIERCTFVRNSSPYGAAVLYYQDVTGRPPVFTNCLFAGNTAVHLFDDPLGWSGLGGAVFSFTQCNCDDKWAYSLDQKTPASEGEDEGDGGGPYPCPLPLEWGCCSCPPNFINCTFVGNRADRGGGAIYFRNDWTSNWVPSMTHIANCIFWDNGEEPLGGILPSVSYCIIEGGFPGSQNYSFDPKFVDAGNGDYRLRPDSPAIDRGRDTSLPEFGGVVDDMFGCPRGYDGDGWPPVFGDGSDYDIGAYEYVPGCTPLLPWQHAADRDSNGQIELSELLRVIQFYQSGAFHCVRLPDLTEDGYDIGPGDQDCAPHSSDYAPQDWRISLREILRLIQLYNSGGYHFCPDEGTEDGFCPGAG